MKEFVEYQLCYYLCVNMIFMLNDLDVYVLLENVDKRCFLTTQIISLLQMYTQQYIDSQDLMHA